MDKNKTISQTYEMISQWYIKNRSYDLFEKPWLDKAISRLKPNAHILDMGCGTGVPIDKYFLEQNFNVTGIDTCETFISEAKQSLCEYIQGHFFTHDMRDLNLNQKFDFIIAWNSFFHLTPNDQKHMFPIFKKHLHDGGLLMMTTGPKSGEVYSDNGGGNLYHASLDASEYQNLLKAYGFEIIDFKLMDEHCNDHTVWLARL